MPLTEERSRTETESSREIVAVRMFDAPRSLVFDAWTDRERIGQWWGPRGFTTTTHEMDVRAGGAWRFIMHGPDGTDYDNLIVYREVSRPERLAYSHMGGAPFDVTVTFAEQGDRTRVTVRMVFESADVRNEIAEKFGAVEGLHQTLDRLEERMLVSASKPFVISRTFDAPRDVVYRVWTEREQLLHWWGPKGFEVFHCTNDLRRGGVMHYGMRGPSGLEMWGKWTYREVTPPERLVFISAFSDAEGGLTRHPLAPEWPAQIFTMISFSEQDGKTTVTVEWTPYAASDIERATFDAGHDSMRGGWGGTFDNLAGYLSKAGR